MNRPRHPMSGIARIAKRPASVPPSGTQTTVIVTASARRFRGTNSAASAVAFGMAPPRPMPVTKRSTASAVMPCTTATASVKTPKMPMHARSAVRRPTRSPQNPAATPPTIMPAYPSDTTGANAALATCQSAMIAGMVMPSIWLSIPSNTTVMAVRQTSHF